MKVLSSDAYRVRGFRLMVRVSEDGALAVLSSLDSESATYAMRLDTGAEVDLGAPALVALGGSTLALVGDGELRCLHTETLEERGRWPLESLPTCLAVDPSGELVACSLEGSLVVFDRSGATRSSCSMPPASALCISPDGRWAAAAEAHDKGGPIHVLDVSSGETRVLKGARAAVTALAPAADGSALSAVAGKKVLRWSLEGKPGKPVALHSGKNLAEFLGAGPGGEQVFWELGGECRVVDASGETLWCAKLLRPSLVRGELFVRRHQDMAVHDVTTGALVRTIEVAEGPLYSGYHAGRSGEFVAVVANRVQIRDALTGAVTSADDGHKYGLRRLYADPAGGRFATSSGHSRVCIWSMDGALEQTLLPGLGGSGNRAEAPVHLTPDATFTGFAGRVQRFDRGGVRVAESERLKSEPSLLALAPGRGLLAATVAHRRAYAEIALLDPETLEVRQRARCERTYHHLLETEGVSTLFGDWCHAALDWDTLEVDASEFFPMPDISRTFAIARDGGRFLEHYTRRPDPDGPEVGSFWLRDVASGEPLLERTGLAPVRAAGIDSRGECAVLAHDDRLAVYTLDGAVREVPLVGLCPSFLGIPAPGLAFVADDTGRSALVEL